MRPVLEFISTLAVGFLAAALIAVIGPKVLPLGSAGVDIARLDYGSLGFGLVLGIVISRVASIGWAELPRRFVGYLLGKAGTLRLIGLAAVLCVVLLSY